MNFEFTEEQQRFREEIRDFCQSTPHGEIDARIGPDFSPEFYRKVAGKGWLGLMFPKEYGRPVMAPRGDEELTRIGAKAVQF